MLGRSPRIWHAVVIGAGPAAALAAHDLARSRGAVLLVDRPRSPAEGLRRLLERPRPRCPRTKRSGPAARGSAASPVTRRCGSAPAGGGHCAASAGVSISRERFDAMLVEAAEAEGGRLMFGARVALMVLSQRAVRSRWMNARGRTSTFGAAPCSRPPGWAARFALSPLRANPSPPVHGIGASAVLDRPSASMAGQPVNMRWARAGTSALSG